MNKIGLVIFFISTILINHTYAGNEGGGGGGICTPVRCTTLAQAGLRIDIKKTEEFEIGMDVIDEINNIVSLINIDFNKKFFVNEVIGKRSTFVVVNQSEAISFQKFKKEYLTILNNSGLDTNKFELLAISQDSTTYLLPGFELLDTRGKALLLFHEALIRTHKVSVTQALIFDGQLLDYLEAAENQTIQIFDMWALMQTLKDTNIMSLDQLNKNLVKNVIEKNPGEIKYDDLCQAVYLNSNCEITREKALQLRKFHPDFAKKLSGVHIVVWHLQLSTLKEQQVFSTFAAKFVTMCEQNPSINETIITDSESWMYTEGFDLYALSCNK